MDGARTILAAVTAAGASSRMGEPKALLAWGDGTVLSTIIDTLRQSGIVEPLVVLGAHRAPIGAEATAHGAVTVENPAWEQGRFSSVKLAATRAHQQSSSLMLWPVDCPAVGKSTITALLTCAIEQPRANIVPRFQDRGGHPIVLCPATVNAIANSDDDLNLRDFLDAAPAARFDLDVDDPAVIANLNRPSDYAAARTGQAKGD